MTEVNSTKIMCIEECGEILKLHIEIFGNILTFGIINYFLHSDRSKNGAVYLFYILGDVDFNWILRKYLDESEEPIGKILDELVHEYDTLSGLLDPPAEEPLVEEVEPLLDLLNECSENPKNIIEFPKRYGNSNFGRINFDDDLPF